MPTYDYRCKACGHELEAVQAFSDDALTTCPVCHEATLRKVFSAVGISFKGSGFYKNDSRGGTSTSSSSSTSSDSGSAGAGSTGTGSSSSDTPSSTPSTSSTTSSSDSKPAKSA